MSSPQAAQRVIAFGRGNLLKASPGAPSPPHFFSPLNTLLPLISKIRQILHPSQPTPKTETIVQPIFDQAMASFAELRGEWMRRSLGVMVGRVEELDEGGIWEGGRGREKVRGLVGLWEVLVVVLEVSLSGHWSSWKLTSNRRRLSSSPLSFQMLLHPTFSHSPSLTPLHWSPSPSSPH